MSTDEPVELGSAIRKARELAGMSQARLAEVTGASQQTIDRIERGETKHSRSVPKLLMALGVAHDDHNPPADGTVAVRLRERMEALKLNPYNVAMQAGFGSSYVRDILRGKVDDPSGSRLLRLATVLECSIYYLLGADDMAGIPPPLESLGPQPEAMRPAPLKATKGRSSEFQLRTSDGKTAVISLGETTVPLSVALKIAALLAGEPAPQRDWGATLSQIPEVDWGAPVGTET